MGASPNDMEQDSLRIEKSGVVRERVSSRSERVTLVRFVR